MTQIRREVTLTPGPVIGHGNLSSRNKKKKKFADHVLQKEKGVPMCVKKLTLLAYEVDIRGSLNILDLHVHCEEPVRNFYARLVNCIYGLALVNMNAIEQNAESIDLPLTMMLLLRSQTLQPLLNPTSESARTVAKRDFTSAAKLRALGISAAC